MKDLDKNIGEDRAEPYEARENKPYVDEETDNDKDVKDLSEELQDNEKGTDGEKENNDLETQADEKEEGSSQNEEETAQHEGERVDTVEQQTYSSCYEPPYYVPNFTTVEQQAPSEKKKLSKAAIVAIVIASALLLLAIFGGAFATSVMLNNMLQNQNSQIGNEELPIIKNSPKLNIEQNTDSDYVPKSLPEVVSKVGNSVVEIRTSSTEYFGQYVTSGAGSGVIVTQSDKAGYLLTNYHVVYGDDGIKADEITVVLTNGDEYAAQIMGSDSSLDLALLRIVKKSDEEFTVAQFGTSSNLVVGQDVIAIGNPLGSLGGTVTDGIISALDRKVVIDNSQMVLLQHNAAINPGNSGGGLFDMMGNLVGIVNAKSSDVGIEGLGFAIPSDIAVNFLNRVMVLEPAIGIRVKYLRRGNTAGLYVVETINESFKLSDRIISINGKTLNSAADYYAVIDSLKIGESAVFTIKRNGVSQNITVTLKN